jgi:hypothetical protein
VKPDIKNRRLSKHLIDQVNLSDRLRQIKTPDAPSSPLLGSH